MLFLAETLVLICRWNKRESRLNIDSRSVKSLTIHVYTEVSYYLSFSHVIRVLMIEGDGHVTKSEFVTLWQSITHQNREHAEAFFYLADLNDDNIIDSSDLNPLYNVFDTDGKI